MNSWMKTRVAHSLLLLLLALSAACGADGGRGSEELQAAGVIEATDIAVAAELSGRIVEVFVAEGDQVEAGDILFRMDNTLLEAQRRTVAAALNTAEAGILAAEAAVDAAQAQYDLALFGALTLAQSERTDIWAQAQPGDFDQPSWYFLRSERTESVEVAVAAAETALEVATERLESVKRAVGSAQFLEAERRLSDARIAYEIAQDLLNHTRGTPGGRELTDASQTIFDEAKDELESAQEAYDNSLLINGAQDILEARAEVAVAEERHAITLDAQRSLQTGADSPSVVAAWKAVEQAKAAQIQAQAALEQLQAELDLFDAQMEKLTVRAPIGGVVLTRSIQPGEVIQAGITALSVAKLDALTVVVYVPENRYGEIRLGDQGTLQVDSFPGESFPATVTRIADRAEYTPQNVQTSEQRQTTVYAVQLTVDNPEGRLKPGMPVDVVFKRTASG